MILNIKGLVTQAENRAPHDSGRDMDAWGNFYSGDSSWLASSYRLVLPDPVSKIEADNCVLLAYPPLPNNWTKNNFEVLRRWQARVEEERRQGRICRHGKHSSKAVS